MLHPPHSGAASDSRRRAAGCSGAVGGYDGGVQKHQETSQSAGGGPAEGQGGADACDVVI